MKDRFRGRGKGIVASSLVISACAPGVLQTQAFSIGEKLWAFLVRTIVYTWKRGDIINSKREELLKLEGMDVLKSVKKALENIKDDSLKDLIDAVDEEINFLYSNGETNKENVVKKVYNLIDSNRVAIGKEILKYQKKCKLTELYKTGFDANTILSASLLDSEIESYKGFIDYITNSTEINEDVKGNYLPLPVLKKEKESLEKEILEKGNFLNSKDEGLVLEIKESNKKAFKEYIEDFVNNIYEEAKKKVASSNERNGLEGNLMQEVSTILNSYFGEKGKSSVFGEGMRSYVYNLCLCLDRYYAGKIKEDDVEPKNVMANALEFLEKYFEEGNLPKYSKLKENLNSGDLMKGLAEDKEVGEFFESSKEKKQIEDEIKEKKGKLLEKEEQIKRSEWCATSLKAFLEGKEDFKESLNSKFSSSLNVIKEMAELYKVSGIKNWDDVLSKEDFLHSLYKDMIQIDLGDSDKNKKELERLSNLNSALLGILESDLFKGNFEENDNSSNARNKLQKFLGRLRSEKWYWRGEDLQWRNE